MFIILLLFLLACLYLNSNDIYIRVHVYYAKFKGKCENQEKRTQEIDSDRKKEKFNFLHICRITFLGVLLYKFFKLFFTSNDKLVAKMKTQ